MAGVGSEIIGELPTGSGIGSRRGAPDLQLDDQAILDQNAPIVP